MDTSRFQEQASSTLTNAAERYAKQLHAIKLLADVDLPEGASLSYGLSSIYVGLYGNDIEFTVDVALDMDANYADRIKPLGAVLRAFRASHVRRDVDGSGHVRFYADSGLGDGVTVVVSCGQGAISPACKVETTTEEVTETRIVTKVVVTCPDPIERGQYV